MEYQFENRFFGSTKRALEVFLKVLLKPFLIFSACFELFTVCCGIWLIWNGATGSGTEILLYALLILVLVIADTAIVFKRNQKNVKIIKNGEKCETVVRFGDRIEMSLGDRYSVAFDYSQIKKLIFLKHSILLCINRQSFVTVSYDFSKGTLDEFLVFIKEKCPEIKIKGKRTR